MATHLVVRSAAHNNRAEGGDGKCARPAGGPQGYYCNKQHTSVISQHSDARGLSRSPGKAKWMPAAQATLPPGLTEYTSGPFEFKKTL